MASSSASKRIIRAALIGLVLISIFLIPGGSGKAEWPQFWYLQPLLIVPLAGAFAGFLHHQFYKFWEKMNWNKLVLWILLFFVYFIGYWLGSVLGLNGTYWN